jgi:ribosomal protein L4
MEKKKYIVFTYVIWTHAFLASPTAADPVRAETSSQCCGECLKGQKISFLIDCIL